MANSGLSRRGYLAGLVTVFVIATPGCFSPYDFGELNRVARTIARDLTENTPYEYSVDENGNEDPGNEVYVGRSVGMLNVSVDAEFAVSEFCNEEYWKTELQQDPERMAQEKRNAFETLLSNYPSLRKDYYYAFRDTMRDLERKENPSYYAFRIDFLNSSIWIEYSDEKAHQLYESLKRSEEPIQTAAQQMLNNGQFNCSAPEDMPRPPETNKSVVLNGSRSAV